MSRSFFTFGQAHAHRMGKLTLDRDVVLMVDADDPRGLVEEMFGRQWSHEYRSLDELDLSWFPRGVVDLTGAAVALDQLTESEGR